jgi:hypothetical protein
LTGDLQSATLNGDGSAAPISSASLGRADHGSVRARGVCGRFQRFAIGCACTNFPYDGWRSTALKNPKCKSG